LRGFAVVRA